MSRRPNIKPGLFALAVLAGACGTPAPAQRSSAEEMPRAVASTPSKPEREPDPYRLDLFSKVLYYVSNQGPAPLNTRAMFVRAMEAVARQIPGMSMERGPDHVLIRLGGQQESISHADVDTLWNLRTRLRRLFGWFAPQIPQEAGLSTAQLMARIEVIAANGMLAAVDRHSVLLVPSQARELMGAADTSQGAAGLVLSLVGGRVCILAVLPGSPAARAGVQTGTLLEKIDEEPIAGLTLDQIRERLRGDVATSVRLELRHSPQAAPVILTVKRDVIAVRSQMSPARLLTAEGRQTEGPSVIGYCRLAAFGTDAERAINDALALFSREGVKGIILDLRGNTGGLYNQATQIADAFLDAGVLATLVGVRRGQRQEERAHAGGAAPAAPVIVLVDSLSASASEILAGTLQRHDRAVIMGEKTFGSGSVQMLFNLKSPVPLSATDPDVHMLLKLTTARVLAASDVPIEGVGITPDIVLRPHDPAQPCRPAAGRASSPVVTYRAELAHEGCPDGTALDFPIRLARDLLARARTVSAKQLLAENRDFLETVAAGEASKLGVAGCE
jgi:carboxyl-terminal processing protease